MRSAFLLGLALVLAQDWAGAEPTQPVTSKPAPTDPATVTYNPPAQTGDTLSNGVSAVARIKDPMACVPKGYPPEARANHEEGSTVLYFLIDIDGTTLESKIGKTSGFPDLDEAALSAFSAPGCALYPVSANGQPVQSWARLKYTWKLQ